jgi:hypothetical protein
MQLDADTVFEKTSWDNCFNKTSETQEETTFIGLVDKFCKEVVEDIVAKLKVC